MPVRRINYTERRRIQRADIDIVLRRDHQGVVSFDAALHVAAYGFPPDARVFIESYRQTVLMRFDFGTVSVPTPPSDCRLIDFDSDAEIRFRVRVTAASDRVGMLLGEADSILPREANQEPDQRIPLLRPVPGELGQEIWRVEFEGEPLLRVSVDLPDWKQTVRSETFRAFVYPAALREILVRVLFREEYTSVDDFADWRSRWLIFATAIPGAGALPKSRDDYDDWIENAVAAFARRFTFKARYDAETKE